MPENLKQLIRSLTVSNTDDIYLTKLSFQYILCYNSLYMIKRDKFEGLPVIIMPKMLTEIPSAARAICRLAESNDFVKI